MTLIQERVERSKLNDLVRCQPIRALAPAPAVWPLWRSSPHLILMASRHSQFTEDLHFRVLKLLAESPDMSQRELADKLGVSNGKLHYCIRALIDKGLVKLGNFANSRHRLGYVYLLTPAGLAHKASIAGRFLNRKMAEYEALRQEIATLQAEVAEQQAQQQAGD